MTVYIFTGSYNEDDGKRTSTVLGVYTTLEAAERAAEKFMDLSSDDEVYCARGTTISSQEIDNGWYEDYWYGKN